MENPQQLQFERLAWLKAVIAEIKATIKQQGQFDDSLLDTRQKRLKAILDKQDKTFYQLCDKHHYLNPLLLIMIYSQEKNHFELPLTCQVRHLLTRKSFFKLGSNNDYQTKIDAAYRLFEHALREELLSKDDIEEMFNHKSTIVMSSAVLAVKPPELKDNYKSETDRQRDQARINLWQIIQISAAQLQDKSNLFIDSIDIRVLCHTLNRTHYLNQTLINDVCTGLKPNSLQYQCFQLFSPLQKKINTQVEQGYSKKINYAQLILNISRLPGDLINKIKTYLTDNQMGNLQKIFLLNKRLFQLNTSLETSTRRTKDSPISDKVARQIETLVETYCPNHRIPWQSIEKNYQQYCVKTPLENLQHTWQWICISDDPILIKTAVVDHMINHDCIDSRGCTPLHLFALTGNIPWINYLLDWGFNINTVDKIGSGLLQYAALGYQHNMIDYLESKGLHCPVIKTKQGDDFTVELRLQKAKFSEHKESLVEDIILNFDEDLYATLFNAYGISLCTTLFSIREHTYYSDLMKVVEHCEYQAQMKYIDIRGSSLKDSAIISGDLEEFHVYKSCHDDVISKYLEYRGNSLQVTANLTDSKKCTPLMHLFSHDIPKAQLTYIRLRNDDLKRTASSVNSDGMTELMVAIKRLIFCEEMYSVILEYIKLVNDTLIDTAKLYHDDETVAMKIHTKLYRGNGLCIAYFKARGKSLNQTALFKNEAGTTEEELFLDCGFNQNDIALAYINARGESLNESALKCYSSGASQAKLVLSNNNLTDKTKITYLNNRKQTLATSNNLINHQDFNEMITCFIECSEPVQTLFIQHCGQSIADSVMTKVANNPWCEGVWAFTLLKPALFDLYLDQIPDQQVRQTVRDKILQQVFSAKNDFFNTLLNSDYSIDIKSRLIVNMGIFQHIDKVHFTKGSNLIFENALLLGSKIAASYAHALAIHSLKEFLQHSLTLDSQQVWRDYGYLTERLPLLKQQSPALLDASDQVLLDKLVEIIDWYNPQHHHSQPNSNNYPWLSFYDYYQTVQSNKNLLAFINACGSNILRPSVMDGSERSELLFVINHCDKDVMRAYVDARGKTVCKTAKAFNSEQRTESLRVIKQADTFLLSKYFQYRAKHLAETVTSTNENDWNEAIQLYCRFMWNDEIRKNYIEQRAECYTEADIDDLPKSFWQEKAIAFVMFGDNLFDHYITQIFHPSIQLTMRKNIIKYAFSHGSELTNKLYDSEIKTHTGDQRPLITRIIVTLGLFNNLVLDKAVIDCVEKDWPIKNCFLMHSTINNTSVSKKKHMFNDPITHIDQFKSTLESLDKVNAWEKYHVFIERLMAIKEIKQQENDQTSVAMIDETIELINQYHPGNENVLTNDTSYEIGFNI